MNAKEFEERFERRVDLSRKVLLKKADEYATEDDRLHNFKVAAELQGVNLLTALAGMMAKHTVSVYDLIKETQSGDRPPTKMWDEKIGDSINYLFLLDAAVRDLYSKDVQGCVTFGVCDTAEDVAREFGENLLEK